MRNLEIKKIIVYLRVELTVLELLAELLSGLVTSLLLVTFLAVVLGIFSVIFLFSVGFLQASTIIYRPLFANYELSLKLYQRVCFWIYFMRSESVCPNWNSLSCVPQKWDYFHTLYLFCQAQSRTSSTKDWLLRADDEFHASITSLCLVERKITEFVTRGKSSNLID